MGELIRIYLESLFIIYGIRIYRPNSSSTCDVGGTKTLDVTPNVKFSVILLLIVGASASTIGITVLNTANLTGQVEDLQTDLDATLGEYDEILLQHESLLSNYSELLATLSILSLENTLLNETYNNLSADFQDLQANYDSLMQTYDTLVQDYEDLQSNYVSLQEQYTVLEDLYDSLLSAYNNLQISFDELQLDFDNLQVAYTILQAQYDTLADTIQQMILPAQYMVFAEAVRRYYFDDYTLMYGTWPGFTRFCRDVILHDSSSVFADTIYPQYATPYGQPDIWFSDVSNALSDVLTPYGGDGSDTCVLAARCLAHLLDDNGLTYFGWDGITGDPLTDIGIIIDQCNTVIDYEYDSTLDIDRIPYSYDYIKFPVETAFRTMGDCEDQAMLAAAYLESCGFDAMMVTIHDPDWNGGSGLYHGVPMVFWPDAWGTRPAGTWGFSFSGDGIKYNDGWWMFLDTTWDTPFGTDPAWLQWYVDTDLNIVFDSSKFTYAVCDINGWVSP